MKLIRKIVAVIIMVVFIYIVASSIGENVYVSVKINQFKNECTINNEYSSSTRKFYSVSRETYETSISFKNGIVKPGAPLDIIVKLDSTYDFPVLHEVISFTIGGHAALVCQEYSDADYDIKEGELIETAYNSENDRAFIDPGVYWEELTFTHSYIILRVNLTEDEKTLVMNKAVSYLGDPYNLSFLFNTKKTHYCSDLMTKSFQAAGKFLNYDGFATTVFDLVVSSQTEIVGYKEYDNNTKVASYYGVNL